MRTIAIVNQKGGCGKTTTAINLAAVLAAKGQRTLLVDLDPQSHCAAGLAVPASQIEFDIGDAMLISPDKGFDPDRLLWRVTKGLDLAPSRTKLAGLEATRGGLAAAPERERRLSHVLGHVRKKAVGDPFAYCIVDCPPSIGLLTYNAITAADEIIIPVETSFFSLQGAAKQVATIRSLGRRLGTRPVTRLLATMHDAAHGLARDLRAELNRRFDGAMIPVTIRLDPSLREAASFGQPIIEYEMRSTGATDYRALGRWVHEDGATGDAEDAAMIEVKQTSVPLGARRRTGEPPPAPARADRPGNGTGVRRGELTAKPLRQTPPAGRDEPTHEEINSSAAATKKAAPNDELTPDQALETMSRVEDLCRRADALHRRLNTPTAPGDTTRLRSSSGPLRLVEQTFNKTRREKSVARLFGARQSGGKLLFVQPIELGVDVRIAGDFNGWSSSGSAMHRNESLGVHELTIDAAPGRHCYRLVVDGEWREDQFNHDTEPNEFGEANNVVMCR